MQGLTEVFLTLLAFAILQRQKVVRCIQFTGEGDFSQKPNDTCKMTLSGSRTVNLDRHSSLSVVWVVRFWFKSLQSLTVYAIWYILCAILGNLTHQCHSSYDSHHWKGEWLYMA